MSKLEELEKENVDLYNRLNTQVGLRYIAEGRVKELESILQEKKQKTLKQTLKQKTNGIEVFLGGTVDSDWREKLISQLEVGYFNPIVKDWDEAAQKKELEKRETCDFFLCVLTPKMKSVYSVAETVDDSNKRPEKTILCVLNEDGDDKFDKRQLNSMEMLKKMVSNNGGQVFSTLKQTSEFLNKFI